MRYYHTFHFHTGMLSGFCRNIKLINLRNRLTALYNRNTETSCTIFQTVISLDHCCISNHLARSNTFYTDTWRYENMLVAVSFIHLAI